MLHVGIYFEKLKLVDKSIFIDKETGQWMLKHTHGNLY